MGSVELIAVNGLYLLALINPISKVSILIGFPSKDGEERFSSLATKSSTAAACILFGAMIVGDWLLRSVFRVDLYSLRLAGGVVVFWVGLNALRHGVFFEHDAHARFESIALVPLACPMIAGPATIAACIGLRAQQGVLVSTLAMLVALGVNHAIMLYSRRLGSLLDRFNILGALVRITGLIVMTIGTQMGLDGVSAWLDARHLPVRP